MFVVLLLVNGDFSYMAGLPRGLLTDLLLQEEMIFILCL